MTVECEPWIYYVPYVEIPSQRAILLHIDPLKHSIAQHLSALLSGYIHEPSPQSSIVRDINSQAFHHEVYPPPSPASEHHRFSTLLLPPRLAQPPTPPIPRMLLPTRKQRPRQRHRRRALGRPSPRRPSLQRIHDLLHPKRRDHGRRRPRLHPDPADDAVPMRHGRHPDGGFLRRQQRVPGVQRVGHLLRLPCGRQWQLQHLLAARREPDQMCRHQSFERQ